MEQAMENFSLTGGGRFGELCHKWFHERLNGAEVLLVPSCTHALELAALLLDIQPGDEVVMPSFADVSSANAFVLRGARIVFVDIRPDTMNLDENKIEDSLTSRTKVIVPVHYGGVGCAMIRIRQIAKSHGLYVWKMQPIR